MAARQTDWVDTLISITVASGAQGFQSLMTGLAPVNLRGVTVIRTIVRLGISSVTVAGAWGTQLSSMAIGITSQEAFAAGVLPDPSVATDKPPRGWMYRTQEKIAQNGIGSVVVYPVGGDIRGARKVENGEVFFVVDNGVSAGTSFSIHVHGLIRQLMKLP